MPKKNIFLLLTLVLILALTACTNKEALNFKKNYEDLNGTVNKNGKEHRTVNISSNNPFIKSSAKEVIEKLKLVIIYIFTLDLAYVRGVVVLLKKQLKSLITMA